MLYTNGKVEIFITNLPLIPRCLRLLRHFSSCAHTCRTNARENSTIFAVFAAWTIRQNIQIAMVTPCFDPLGSGIGCFFDPLIRIRDVFSGSQNPDLGSLNHISETLVTNFNSLSIDPKFVLNQFKNKRILNFVKCMATKKGKTTNLYPHPLFCSCWIQDRE